MVLEMDLERQVKVSTQIVEGRVISKNAEWNADYTFIYTVNTVEVYKVFKGQPVKEIKIITPGGFINGEGVLVNPSLKMNLNEVGIFMLKNKRIDLAESEDIDYYRSTGSIQGFYRYDMYKDIYANTYKSGIGITTEFYEKLTRITKVPFLETKEFNVNAKRAAMLRKTAPVDIISISPLTISAGTDDILTITGSDFGNTIGTIAFPRADDGGRTYLEAYNSHILSWSDSEIILKVPSYAGSGSVRVETNGGNLFQSDELTISYAHLNVEEDDETIPLEDRMEYKTQLYNRDGNGGYEWLYSSGIDSNEPAKEAFDRAFSNWVCNTEVNWELVGATTLMPNIFGEEGDGFNVVGFRDDVGDDDSGDDGTTIAYAISRFIGCGNASGGLDIAVEDTDLVFNSTLNYNYGPGNPMGNDIDFETVALHELGHALQLNHIIDPGALMHYAVDGGNVVRDFEPNDITGANAIINRSVNDQICGLPVMSLKDCTIDSGEAEDESLVIFPNPATDIIYIKTPTSTVLNSIALFDSLERLIFSFSDLESENFNSINVTNLSSGIYFLNLDLETGAITKKVIIN